MPKLVPDRLGAGGSGEQWGQSARGSLLLGASVAGHWRNGEVLVSLHLPVWDNFSGHWHRRDGSDLQLQRPAADQSGVGGAAGDGTGAAAAGHCLLDCPQEEEEEKERGDLVQLGAVSCVRSRSRARGI